MKENTWVFKLLGYVLVLMVVWSILGLVDSFASFIFGLVLSLFVGMGLLSSSDRKAKKIGGSDDRVYDVNQSRKKVVSMDFNKAFELCREALRVSEDTVITKEDRETGMLEAKKGAGFLAIGYLIVIKLTKISDEVLQIDLETRPAFKTVFADAGESWKIIEELSGFIWGTDETSSEKALI